jgi:hypothetical protein
MERAKTALACVVGASFGVEPAYGQGLAVGLARQGGFFSPAPLRIGLSVWAKIKNLSTGVT